MIGRSASARQSTTSDPDAARLCRAIASRTGSTSLPTTNDAETRSAASSEPIEQVASCTVAPASRRARCSATGCAVACCSASSVNNHPEGSANFAAARRRNCTVSTRTAVRSANRLLAEAMSGISVDSASASRSTSISASRSRVAAQIADVVEVERYDGLTPVTMTL